MSSQFKPMLAKDGEPETLEFPIWVQPKLDGIRISIVDGRPVTRTLKDVPNKSVREMLSNPVLNGLDGEIMVGDPTAEDAYRTTNSFVMAQDKVDEPWVFYIFDKWDLEHPFTHRSSYLNEFFYNLDHNPGAGVPEWYPHVKPLPTHRVDTIGALDQLEANYTRQGFEGVIARTNSLYKFGRSGKKGPLLKIKRFIDFEAEVLDLIEQLHNANEAKVNALGRTERSSHKANKIGKDTLGAIVCRAINGPHEGQEFRVGTGFDDALRKKLWEEAKGEDDFTALNGTIIKVKSFPVGVKDAPRHPVFLGFRDMELDG